MSAAAMMTNPATTRFTSVFVLRACFESPAQAAELGLESRLQAVSAPRRLKAGLQTEFQNTSQRFFLSNVKKVCSVSNCDASDHVSWLSVFSSANALPLRIVRAASKHNMMRNGPVRERLPQQLLSFRMTEELPGGPAPQAPSAL